MVTPTKRLQDVVTDSGTPQTIDVDYGDIGTMMEKELLGGALELRSNDP